MLWRKNNSGKMVGRVGAVEILHTVVREGPSERVAFGKNVKRQQSESCGY